MESPEASDCAGYFGVKIGRLQRLCFHDEAASQRIDGCGQVDARPGLRFYMQYEIVREFGGEDQRSTIGGKNERGLARAKDLRRFDRAQRRGRRWPNRRKPHYDD